MQCFHETVTNYVLFIVNPEYIMAVLCLGQVGLSVCGKTQY